MDAFADAAEPVVHLRRVGEPVVAEHGRECRQAVSDRRGHRDLTDEVEPTCRPAPAGAAHLGRPVVKPAGGRVGRRDLCHRKRDDRRHETHEEPAVCNCHRAAALERNPVRGQAPGEDRDDREGDGEVPEPAHSAEELLRIAESVEKTLVFVRMEMRRPPVAFEPLLWCHEPSSLDAAACRSLRVFTRAGRTESSRPAEVHAHAAAA